MDLTWQQSIGIDQAHLVNFKIVGDVDSSVESASSPSFLVHQSIKKDLQNLFSAAKKDGLELTIISSYRSFERQLCIWNDKWQGHRPVYSRHGRPLNVAQMSDMEKYKAISLWSALPGLSRHHWGTDLDIFLEKPIHTGHKVELIPQEFAENGVCHRLKIWMDANLEKFGFFRPYQSYKQGISEEPWHISHRITSENILKNFHYGLCLKHLGKSEIKSKDFICDIFEHYQQKYFLNICE